MSDDRQESDPTDQASDPSSSAADPAEVPAADNTVADAATDTELNTADSTTGSAPTDSLQPSATNTRPDFEPVTIRSYLAEQFGVREVEPPVQHAAPITSPTDATAELAKWRERVPKLASALKERKAQVDLLEIELARLQTEISNVSGSGAGLKARDEHIAALELKLASLTTSYQNSEGSLRARELELEDLRSDLQASKMRWQSLTDALDQQVVSTEQAQAQLQLATEREAALQATLDVQQSELAAKDRTLLETQQSLADQVAADAALVEQLKEQAETLSETQEQLAGLDERNEKLLETTELANHQLAALSGDLTRLQGELVSKDQESVAKLAEQKQLNLLDTAQIQAEHSERLRDIHAQTLLVFEAVERQNLDERRSGIAAVQESLAADFCAQEQLMQRDYNALQQAAGGLMQQVSRLQKQITHDQQASVEANAEHASARQIAANEHQQALLNVTLTMEAELRVVQDQLLQQQLLQQQLEQQLRDAQDGQIEAQPRIVMLGEISDANPGRSDFEQAWDNLDDHSADVSRETIRELERLLQIRNEELKAALAAQVHFLPAASLLTPLGPNLAADGESVASVGTEPDVEDSVAALQAQIYSTRNENERLRKQLERTSAALLASDDLTQLKGVGGKLAEQLRELGISQFAQMAALDMAELEAPDHPLHNLRGRIERNGWIEQAKSLVHPLTLYGKG